MSTSMTAFKDMTTNVNVGIDEVVSVFVSKYETALFAEKDRLGDEIKSLKKDLTSQDERLISKIDLSVYNTSIPVLNLVSKVEGTNVNWDENGKSKVGSAVVVSVKIEDTDKNGDSYYTRSIEKKFYVTIDKREVEVHFNVTKQIEDLNAQLLKVMGDIKNVSRKERQVRGRISELKLEQSGYSDLLKSDEMLKLVQL